MPELILSLRERELSRLTIVAVRTTIGRDPSCDMVIDNAGISRLHASIEAIGDSFVLKDCNSENGITLNGDPCREGRLVHGDIIGLNKFLLRFSNQTLEAPVNLQHEAAKPQASRPKDVQRTVHLGAEATLALVERAKQQIAAQRAATAARPGESLPPLPAAPEPARARVSPPVEEPEEEEEEEEESARSPLFLGAVLLGSALIVLLVSLAAMRAFKAPPAESVVQTEPETTLAE